MERKIFLLEDLLGVFCLAVSRPQDRNRYDKLAEKLKNLQEQKRRIETDVIMEAYLKSGKSFNEIMTFLRP